MRISERGRVAAAIFLAAACGAGTARGQLASFPGAQGFGATATGGRAGSIYVVTNLNSSGAGSFEDAVSQSNRIIVFAVGGDVNMSAAYSCASNLTILGQTAPGEGIGFLGHEISFTNSANCIIQYIRAREGSADTSAKASINLGDSDNMILDHIDAEFSQYDNIDAVGANSAADNITLQNSLIADPIKKQVFNMHTEGNQTTYLNNIFANAEGRSVLAKSNTQFVDNVVYDYGYAYTTGNSKGVYSYDLLDNYFMAGPSTSSAGDAWYQLDSNQSAYSSGNLLDSNKNGVLDGSATTPGGVIALTSEWSPATQYLPTLSATAAYGFDLAHAGALYPNGNGTFGRDDVDSQIVSQVGSYGTSGKILNENDDDGLSNNGLGTLPTTSAVANTLDTVPFTWLTTHGLSTTNASQLLLHNPLGYDMIEEYAQQVGDQYASQTATTGDWTTTTWSSTTPGIYDHALIRGTGGANGTVTIASPDAASAFSVSIGGNGPAAGESLSISSGSLTVQDTIYIGDQNNGTLTISGGTVRAANIQLGNTVFNSSGVPTSYVGTLNFNGGTLQLSDQIVQGAGTPGNWTSGAAWNWSGGTLQGLGTLNISAPATIGSGGAFVNTNGYNDILSGSLGGSGALIKLGAGTLVLLGNNTYLGGTTVDAGTVVFKSTAAFPAGSPLTVASGALVQAANSSSNILLNVSTLSFTGTGTLDLADNDMIIQNISAGTLFNDLKAGFNTAHGYWNGSGGITSTTAAADTRFLTTLGFRQSSGSPFDGVNTTTADMLVMYTYYGDANLDGTVNGADYQQIDNGFGGNLTGWQNGDFNYDGVVDGSDFSLIDNTFNQITASGASPLAMIASPSNLIESVAMSPVPEPAMLGLLGFGAVGMLRRRR